MLHLPPLITDLTIILIAAACTTIIFKLIKQPVVLGYIIAGLLVGPHISFLPTITDDVSIKIWAEIGVVFLLFALGLEFSFKKLVSVGVPALITGVAEVIFMLAVGYLGGRALGWNSMDSLFLGGILSISSTTIIIRAFQELGVQNKKFASLVFGVLIIEDLVAILLLVILSTIGVSQQFRGEELFFSIIKLGFFLIIWFLGGIFLLPLLFKKIKTILNDEMSLILSLALCFMMVYFATHVGFSPALGAFIMGSLLAETSEGKKIEHLFQPVKDLFAAIFFVSVGMLIDPKSIAEHWSAILIITVITIIGKIVSTTLGSLISGQRLKSSVQAGFSLAQIGEFSFIIATLGVSLKVTSDFLYPLAVAVSVITTFTTPYLIKSSGKIAEWLEKNLPNKTVNFLTNYSASVQSVSAYSETSQSIKSFTLRLTLLSIIIIAFSIIGNKFLLPFLSHNLNNKALVAGISFSTTFLFSSPFFWAMLKGQLNQSLKSIRNAYLQYTLNGFLYLVIALLIIVQISLFFSFGVGAIVFLGLSFVIVHFSEKLGGVYNWVEATFMDHLQTDGHKELQKKTFDAPITPWDAFLAQYEIAATWAYLGKTLEELKLREKCGVTVVMIERGQYKIKAPGKDDRLFPFDIISVLGTDEQLIKFKAFIEETGATMTENITHEEYTLYSYTITEDSSFLGKTIRHSGVREKTDGLVVGLERNKERFLNPDSMITLELGDFLWIVGNKRKIKEL